MLITFYFVLGLSLYPDVKIAVRNVSITPKINKSFIRIAPIHIFSIICIIPNFLSILVINFIKFVYDFILIRMNV